MRRVRAILLLDHRKNLSAPRAIGAHDSMCALADTVTDQFFV